MDLPIRSKSTDGSFQDFIKAVTQAELEIGRLKVRFNSPGNGVLEFNWTGPLTLDGVDVPLTDYHRFENPYAQVAYNSGVYEIAYRGMGLFLDFAVGVRVIR